MRKSASSMGINIISMFPTFLWLRVATISQRSWGIPCGKKVAEVAATTGSRSPLSLSVLMIGSRGKRSLGAHLGHPLVLDIARQKDHMHVDICRQRKSIFGKQRNTRSDMCRHTARLTLAVPEFARTHARITRRTFQPPD